MRRREFVFSGLAAALTPLQKKQVVWKPRYSICSEIFEGWSVEKTAPFIGQLGYRGLEIAPFWLSEHADSISPKRRKEIKSVLADNGVVCSGLHWILITPKWLHVTTPEDKIRNDSWDYVRKLVDLCADMGGKIIVFGSPKQRTSRGIPAAQAVQNLVNGFVKVAPYAGQRGVTICMEPISSNQQCDVVNTMKEAADVVRRVNHRAVQSMFDVHNTPDETEPLDVLIKKHAGIIRHVHINEMDGSYPGTRGLDFRPVFRALKEIRFPGWVSLEVFDFKPGPEKIARESMQFMQRVVAEG